MLMASRMAIVGELLNRRIAEVEIEDDDPGHMLLTGFARTVAEVGAAMHLSPSAASQVVSQAESLTNRLPRVAQVLRRGEIDWESVAVIIAHTELVVTQSILARLDATLAERIAGWTSWSRKRVSNAVDALVRELDPDAIAERGASRAWPVCTGDAGGRRYGAVGGSADRAGWRDFRSAGHRNCERGVCTGSPHARPAPVGCGRGAGRRSAIAVPLWSG